MSIAPPLPDLALRAPRAQSPRPLTWDGLIGNERAVAILQEAAVAAVRRKRAVPHVLLFGGPGTGKTSFAGVLAAQTGGHLIEATGGGLGGPKEILAVIAEMNAHAASGRPSVLFIDEIHRLGRRGADQEAFYPLLEDFRFPHALIGKTIPLRGGEVLTMGTAIMPAHPFTCIGATTEPGLLSEPLRRRFIIHIDIEPYSQENIEEILCYMAERLGLDLDLKAAVRLAQMSRGTPGRAYQLLRQAEQRADVESGGCITLDIAEDIIERLGLYPRGLTETDLRVLRLLAERGGRGMGRRELAQAAHISDTQFGGLVEPYLSQLGMLQTLARRVITPEGLAYLKENA